LSTSHTAENISSVPEKLSTNFYSWQENPPC